MTSPTIHTSSLGGAGDIRKIGSGNIGATNVLRTGKKGLAAATLLLDLAKGLIDEGYHPMTVYFPLVVEEAVMIEPTETESKETLDAFAAALFRITEESVDSLRSAPHSTRISRPDDVAAARRPITRWTPE